MFILAYLLSLIILFLHKLLCQLMYGKGFFVFYNFFFIRNHFYILELVTNTEIDSIISRMCTV